MKLIRAAVLLLLAGDVPVGRHVRVGAERDGVGHRGTDPDVA